MGKDQTGRTPKQTSDVRRTCSVRNIWLIAAIFLLAACTGSSKQSFEESSGLALSGSVGDGPIIDAEILIRDAEGTIVFSGTSDSSANYQFDIPDGTYLPVTVHVSGGIDLVTGRGADFKLVGVGFESGPVTLNVSPYTTLAVRTAQCMGDLSPENIETAWQLIDNTLNFGWNSDVIADPMGEVIGDTNIATVVLGNEALGEIVRRTSAALAGSDTPLDNDDVMEVLACDLADGVLNGSGTALTRRIALTTFATATAVRLEVIAGMLHVDGQDATALLDSAISTVLPGSSASVEDVAPNEQLIDQAVAGLMVLQTTESPELLELAFALESATPATARGQLTPLLEDAVMNTLAGLGEQAALMDEGQLSERLLRQADVGTRPPPVLSFAANDSSVASGATTILSWASSNAEFCTASGGWTGDRPLQGLVQTEPLTAATEFTLSCGGLGGVVSNRTFVDLSTPESSDQPVPDPNDPEPTPIPEPLPTISFTADRTTVDAGDNVTLNWSASNAAICRAGGSWTGDRSVSGNQIVGPLNADMSFTLTCTGTGGTAQESVQVAVIQPLPAPGVDLAASAASVESGSATTLIWSSSNATSCSASGGWSGPRATQGSASTGPLTTGNTFTLSCSGPGGGRSDSVTVAVTELDPVEPPVVSLSLADSTIDPGDSTTIRWSTSNATECTASGDWTGSRSVSGSQSVAPASSASYTLSCIGEGGSENATVNLTVSNLPPELAFAASQTAINAGGSVTLTWNASHATACTAGGGWSGSKGTAGEQLVGPINARTTYSLSCTGPGGNVIEMLTVDIISQLSLSWIAPNENVDGTELTDLGGYRIYYGTESRAYSDMVEVGDSSATSQTLNLSSGDYFIAMTALDLEGNESTYSNEVLKTSP